MACAVARPGRFAYDGPSRSRTAGCRLPPMVDARSAVPEPPHHRDRQQHPQRRDPHVGARAGCLHLTAPVDRRRVRARVRRSAPHDGKSRRPDRTQGRHDNRSRGVRDRLSGRRLLGGGQRAHRVPRGHGLRRSDDHAGDVVDPRQRLHRCAGAAAGNRVLVADERGGDHGRPDHRRLAAATLLVGFDLLRERAGRRDRDRRRASTRPDLTRPECSAERPGRLGALDRRPRRALVRNHQRPGARLGQRHHVRAVRSGIRRARGLRHLGAAPGAPDAPGALLRRSPPQRRRGHDHDRVRVPRRDDVPPHPVVAARAGLLAAVRRATRSRSRSSS